MIRPSQIVIAGRVWPGRRTYARRMSERLNLEGLRYAHAVAQAGSFSAAARAYGVTQPALSNGIARLEDRLGGQLFERSPRGVSPTAFGAHMLPLVERALAALDAVSAEASRWHTPPADVIRVGVSPLISPQLVARAYSAVCGLPGSASNRRLVLREANMTELKTGLAAGELDVIMVPSVAPMPRFEHHVIESEPVVLVEPAPSSQDSVELAELARRQLILIPDTCGLTTFTRDLLTSHNLPLRAYPGEALSYRVLEEWAGLGLGSALVPRSKLSAVDTPPPAPARRRRRGGDLLRGRVGPRLSDRARPTQPRRAPRPAGHVTPTHTRPLSQHSVRRSTGGMAEMPTVPAAARPRRRHGTRRHAMAYLQITLVVDPANRPAATAVYEKYKQPFLETVPGATSKQLLVREADVQVLHGFDSVEQAKAYLGTELFTKDVVNELAPLLGAQPEVRVYDAL